MDDDGKNSETDLVGELWAPQNVCLIWSQCCVSHIRGGHRDLSARYPKHPQPHGHCPGSGSWITTEALGLHCRAWLCQQWELGRLCWHGSSAFRPSWFHTSCPGLDLREGQGLPCRAWSPAVGSPAGAAQGSACSNTVTPSLLASTSRHALSVASSSGNRWFSAEWAGNKKFTGKLFEWILRLLCWGFFSPCAFAGHLLTKASVEKMYYVICSILQALLLMV